MQFSAEGQPWWFQWLWEADAGMWPRKDQQVHTLMWGRQSHPPQRTLSQSPSSTVRKVKGERFYSGEELPKILICDKGRVGMEAGASASVSARRHRPESGRAWPLLDTVLGERKEKSGLGVVTSKELGDIRKGQELPRTVPWQSLEPSHASPPGKAPPPTAHPPPHSQGPLVDDGGGRGEF